MDGNPPSPIEFHHAADRGDEAAGAVANSLELEVAALNNRPFPSLRSLLCLAQRSFPLFVGVVPNAALRKDRVGDFELRGSSIGAIRLGAISKSYQAVDKVHKSSEI